MGGLIWDLSWFLAKFLLHYSLTCRTNAQFRARYTLNEATTGWKVNGINRNSGSAIWSKGKKQDLPTMHDLFAFGRVL